MQKYSIKQSSTGPYFFPKCQNVLSIPPGRGYYARISSLDDLTNTAPVFLALLIVFAEMI